MLNKENQRELAYVVVVDAIKPIDGKDRVECAVVNGWTCMVPKDQFKPGDLGIYFEIDSLCPADNEAFAFLEKRHYRVKTQKFKTPSGPFWSQGLLMHPSDFGWDSENLTENQFLTETLGITYYEPEDNKRKAKSVDKYKKMAQRHQKLFKKPLFRWLMRRNWGKKLLFVFFGKVKVDNAKAFPSHLPYISKSDEERAENIPFILQDKAEWVKTTKIDGTSSLFLLERKKRNKFEYWVCSRNVRQLDSAQETFHQDNVYWEVEEKYHIRAALEDILNNHPEWSYVAIQGETAGCSNEGNKIQGDPHKFGELRFFGYNFIESSNGRWETPVAKSFVESYDIPWVPVIDEHYILPDDFEEFKMSADGSCEAEGASGNREGYVYRRAKFEDGKINSFKNVSRVYLEKH